MVEPAGWRHRASPRSTSSRSRRFTLTTTPTPLTDVRIEIGLPTLGGGEPSGSVADVAAAARHAEALGFDGVSAADLLLGDGTPTLEAIVALAAAATATQRVSIEFGVLALPLRPLVWLAAQVQALQHVSGNRVLLGVGSGGLPDAPIWQAAGVSRRERGPRTDTALRLLPDLIAGVATRLTDLPGQPVVTLTPSAPVPPILVGGNSETAIRRAAAYGDGWLPSQISPETLAAGAVRLRELAAEHGRPAPAVHVGGLTILAEGDSLAAARAAREAFVRNLPGRHGITVEDAVAMVVASPAEAAERIAGYAQAGAVSVGFSPGSGGTDDWLRHAERSAQARSLLT